MQVKHFYGCNDLKMVKLRNVFLLLRSPSSCCLHSSRKIFSVNGIWDQFLSIELKKDIEKHWKETVKSSHEVNNKNDDKEKMYILSMFPYPSGKLHMGHVRVYTISDAMARFHRLLGKNVIHPMGWDSFGLPAENAAIEKGVPPGEWTESNITKMSDLLHKLGYSFDWQREISTCSTHYYKWTQYLFLKLYEKGLAYRREASVNWDPVDQTVLADEQVDENGRSWRSGAAVERKQLRQWFVATTKYAKSLSDGLNDSSLINWRDVIKLQKHWIGNCSGFRFHFPLIADGQPLAERLETWTESPELLCGATFIVISPSHHLNKEIFHKVTDDSEDVLLNLEAVNPITKKNIPIYVSEKLECTKATSTLLGTPCENEDHFEFASHKKLPIVQVIDVNNFLINSEQFSGTAIEEARRLILDHAEKEGFGGYPASDTLRDWLVSRQRYWGTPIPIIHCNDCGEVPVPYEDLPVKLPPSGSVANKDGSSQLRRVTDWIKVKCPRCGCDAERETDTLDTFFDSSWYYLRYLSPNNSEELVSKQDVDRYMPVDLYIGGKEHATLHLYYARFMNHFCHDIGIVNTREPFQRLLVHGMVTGKAYKIKGSGKYIPKEDVDFSTKPMTLKGTDEVVYYTVEKMGKSRYNGIDPEDAIQDHSLDTVRLLMMSTQSPTTDKRWPSPADHGINKFEERLWMTVRTFLKLKNSDVAQTRVLSKEDQDKFEADIFDARNYYLKGIFHHYNTTYQLSVAISKMMGLIGALRNVPIQLMNSSAQYERTLAALIITLSPIMPHFTSELWSRLASVAQPNPEFDWTKNVMEQRWPEVDADYKLDLTIYVNNAQYGAFKIEKKVLESMSADAAINMALRNDKVKAEIGDSKITDINYETFRSLERIVQIKTERNDSQRSGNNVENCELNS